MQTQLEIERTAVSSGTGFSGVSDRSKVQLHPEKRFGMGRYTGAVTTDPVTTPGVFRATAGAIDNFLQYGVIPVTVMHEGEVICMGLTEAYKRHLPEHAKGLALYEKAPAIDVAGKLARVLFERANYE